MNTPYLIYKELLPSGRLAWRRMINPQFSQVPAVDVAYQLKTNFHKPVIQDVNVPNSRYTNTGIQRPIRVGFGKE